MLYHIKAYVRSLRRIIHRKSRTEQSLDDLKKMISAGKITRIIVMSLDGKEIECYRLNNNIYERED